MGELSLGPEDELGRKRQVENRERVLRGAHELVVAEGMKALTVDRLARRVRMSKSTLYAHFRNKEALVLALVEDAAKPFLARLAEIGGDHPRVELEAVLDAWQRFGDGVPGPMHLERDELPAVVRKRLDSVHEHLEEAVHGLVHRAEDAGLLALEVALVKVALPAAAAAAVRARAAGELKAELRTLLHAFVR